MQSPHEFGHAGGPSTDRDSARAGLERSFEGEELRLTSQGGLGGYGSDYLTHDFAHQWNRPWGEHYGKGPKGWKRSDERIRDYVCEALYRAGNVDASGIEVAVHDGVVILSGTVNGRATKRAAEACVEHVPGVRDVRNELRLA